MKKRLVATLLTLAMATTVVVGCGAEDSGKVKQESQDSKGEQSVESAQNIEVQSSESSEVSYDKELEIDMWYAIGTDYTASNVPSENVVLDWLENETNVTVENIIGNGGGSSDAKLPQLIAGGTLPEVIFTENTLTAMLAEEDMVYELTEELLKEYAPNVWEKVPASYWEESKINGKNYTIPGNYRVSATIDSTLSDDAIAVSGTPVNTRTTSLWVRDDILKMVYPDAMSYDECVALMEKEGRPIGDLLMDVPITSTEEFIEFFYKIKELELKEGDMPVYAFGFDGGDNWQALAVLGPEMFGARNYYYIGAWDDETNEVYLPLVTDFTKEMARTVTQMIIDDVIEEESLVHTSAQYQAKCLNGNYAVVVASYMSGGITSMNAKLKEAGKDYQYRPLYLQYDNDEEHPAYTTPLAANRRICITSALDEEDLPQVLNWINTQYSEEFEEVYYWGPADAGMYVENADGTRRYVDEKIQKYLVEGDTSVCTLADLKGLANSSCHLYINIFATFGPEYYPSVYNGVVKYKPIITSGFAIPASSEYSQGVKLFPNHMPYDAMYSSIPEVKEYWNCRQQWEEPLKLVFAASSNEDFEVRWQNMVDTLNSLVDVEAVEKAMTEVAREQCAKLGIE